MRTQQLIEEFLAQKRIAVAGVSRDSRQPANAIFRRLLSAGHEVFAVNSGSPAVSPARLGGYLDDSAWRRSIFSIWPRIRPLNGPTILQ